MTHPLLPPSLTEHTLWEKESDPIWLSSSFMLRRNLARSNFPPKMNEGQMRGLLETVKKALLDSSLLEQPLLFKAEELSGLNKEFIFEHFLCPESFQSTLAGQAFVVDQSSRFLSFINVEDHLQLQLIDSLGKWEETYHHLSQLDEALGNALEFAFSPRFGYLTADLGFCGTGLEIFCYLHLPGLLLTKELEDTLLKQKEEGVVAAGILGTMEDLVGDLVVLRNQYTLGTSEDTALHTLHSTAMKLSLAERTARAHLKQEESAEIKDHIARALGLLTHSYQLQTKEALNALSMLKLGVDLKWVEGITAAQLNELFFLCQHAHLAHLLKDEKLSQADASKKRAEYLHGKIKEVHLKI